MDYYGSRNKILYAWHNVPLTRLPGRLAGMTIRAATFSPRPDRITTRLRGMAAAYALAFTGRLYRQPVPLRIYELSQELKRRGPLPLERVETRLPGRVAAEAALAAFEKASAQA